MLDKGIDWDDDYNIQDYTFEDDVYCKGIQSRFGGSSDFYGRIIIYNLEEWSIE